VIEVADAEGGSTVWEEQFAGNVAAVTACKDGVRQMGLAKLFAPDGDDRVSRRYQAPQ
jgi:hypothetical protein